MVESKISGVLKRAVRSFVMKVWVKQFFVMSLLMSGCTSIAAHIVFETVRPVGFMAQEASTQEYAEASLERAGFTIAEEMATLNEATTDGLVRKLSKSSGEGFWDITIRYTRPHEAFFFPGAIRIDMKNFPGSHRIVSYAPGEYVQPHWHDVEEVFTIKAGGCYVWMSMDNGLNWTYNYCGVGPLVIPAGAWHCLIADEHDGLCMDVWHDVGRSIEWCDEAHSKGWSSELVYPTSVADLRGQTLMELVD